MNPARADLLDPAALAALGNLEIVARWVVDGFITGLHRSPRRGFSVEFAEHRPYQPGDDLRYLDWRIAARADRWVVKQFEEETNLRATIVLDVSKSMAWSSAADASWHDAASTVAAPLTKLDYAERLVAALSLLLLRQRDAVGLIRFDEHVRSVVPPRARHGQWRRLLASLAESGAGTQSKAGDALGRAARLVRRAGMVVLISDLLVDPDEVEQSLRGLRGAGHDVNVLHLLDPAERDLADRPGRGRVRRPGVGRHRPRRHGGGPRCLPRHRRPRDRRLASAVRSLRRSLRDHRHERAVRRAAAVCVHALTRGRSGIGDRVASEPCPISARRSRSPAAPLMELLAPYWAALAAAAAVPLLIHLMRRRIGTRIAFPAVRYLLRAEQEQSARLRLRNWLLMALRVLAVLLLALAAARPIARIGGAGHPPTAVAIVLDNSLSTSVVVDGRPLFASLRSAAEQVLDDATDADRVWLVTADGRVVGSDRTAARAALAHGRTARRRR